MDVKILADVAVLEADFEAPKGSKAIVIFAHGSGSSRFSPRNRLVASELNKAGFATLLLDLLTKEEESKDTITAEYRFDIEMLAKRLVSAARWAADRFSRIGYFGASTGAAAALVAAAKRPLNIKAVVSRGGRPDLASEHLAQVKAPTLLIVGSDDEVVIGMNKAAIKEMRSVKKLEIISGASHLFEEKGKLEEVSRLAVAWFKAYLSG